MKIGVKKFYRKQESVWDDDGLPDKHKKHLRKIKKLGRRKLKRKLHRYLPV